MVEGEGPKLVRRRENRKSTIKIGRTIGEARERLETANERAAARKKDKHKKAFRIIFTIVGFFTIILALVGLYFGFRSAETTLTAINSNSQTQAYDIEIIDEESASTGAHLTNRMNEYINQAVDYFHELGFNPTKAVIPTGSIREVDFYLEDYPGFIKTTIDRGVGVTVEDAKRMLDYLESIDVTEFTYIDVRIEGKAYWK